MLKIETYSFPVIRDKLDQEFSVTKPFHRGNWQGLDVQAKPEMAVHELLHVSIDLDLRGHESYEWHRSVIKPNLPWADDHFEERVCGWPINPGIEWANWPWGNSADKFREERGLFNHNYMERYWPRYAGRVDMPTKTAEDWHDYMQISSDNGRRIEQRHGIRGRYGDLNDVVAKLVHTPTTRQAILPVYFPEDTALLEGRQPCSMYYHFLVDRYKRMDVVYPMRSCDYVRHFADDVYMTVRLLLWVLERARKGNDYFADVKPGKLVMHIANLHMFKNDFIQKYGRQ